VLLLLSGADVKDCRAKTFERTLFRDPKIVAFSKKFTVPYRLNRFGNIGKTLYKDLKLDSGRPALILFDSDGEILFNMQNCEGPEYFSKALGSAAKTSKKKIKYSKRAEPKIAKIQQYVSERKVREALKQIYRLKPSSLRLPQRSTVDRYREDLKKTGIALLNQALDLEEAGDSEPALALFKKASHDYKYLKRVSESAKAGIKRLRSTK